MKQYVLPGLIANSATLGVHWIYDVGYLKQLSKKQSILWMTQTKDHYSAAHPSFYVYPHNKVGDVSVQGNILMWLYHELREHPKFDKQDFSRLMYDKFRPGGEYVGYAESYSNQHVFNILTDKLKADIEVKPLMDDQLVGFMPYLACKELGFSSEKAYSLANVYTNDENYLTFYKMFDRIIENAPEQGLQQAIEDAIEDAPEEYIEALNKAIEMTNTNEFIQDYAGRACSIRQAIPLIIHILYHSTSFQEATELNALMGGASSDRATLIGALAHLTYKIPDIWLAKTKNAFQL